MSDELHQVTERYVFNGTPAQFGREVKTLILSHDARRQPAPYIAGDFTPRRPYEVDLLDELRTTKVGRVATRRNRGNTILFVSWLRRSEKEARQAWEQLKRDLAMLDWKIKIMSSPPPTDAALAEYYRRRASGQKTTLENIAREFGFSPAYLRRVKADYDRRFRGK